MTFLIENIPDMAIIDNSLIIWDCLYLVPNADELAQWGRLVDGL